MNEGAAETNAGASDPARSGLSAAEWQAVVSAVREGVVVHDSDGRIVSANEAAGRILGLTTDQLLGLTCMDQRWRATRADGSPFPGEEHPAMVTLRTGEPVTDEIMSVEVPDDGQRWIRVSARVLHAPDDPRRVVATFVDITSERGRMLEYRALAESTSDLVARASEGASIERRLADAEELFRQAFDEAPIGMAMTSIDDVATPTILRANHRYAAALGCTVEEVVGRVASEFTHADDHEASCAARSRLLNGETTHERMHVRIRRGDGSTAWHVLTRTLLRDQAGAPRYVLAQLEDASAAQDIVSRLAVMAHTDPLTGLLNRRGLEAELATVLEDPYAIAHTSVLFLDLDGFKAVNDRLGHTAGDDALRHVGDRLTLLTRGHDTVARFGGDEFVVIARHLVGDAAARLVADRLSTVLFEAAGDPPIVVRASIGTTRPRPGDDAGAIIERADRDMYRRKRGAAR